MLGQEHLAHMSGTGADMEVNDFQALFRSGFHALVGNGREPVHQGGDILFLRQAAGFHLDEHGARFVRQDAGLIGFDARGVQQAQLGIQLPGDGFTGFRGFRRIKACEGRFGIEAVFVNADNRAALSGNGFAGYRLGPLGNGNRKSDGVRGQDRDIIILPAKQGDQFLQSRSDPVQIGRKRCFHKGTPFLKYCDKNIV